MMFTLEQKGKSIGAFCCVVIVLMLCVCTHMYTHERIPGSEKAYFSFL